MPELSDVESFKVTFGSHALDRPIADVEVTDRRIVRGTTPGGLVRKCTGRTFTGSHRHGKFQFGELDDSDWAVFHFGMTGRWHFLRDRADAHRHTRVFFDFDDGTHLAYVSQRMLGEVGWTKDPQHVVEDRGLGPDAWRVETDRMTDILDGRRGRVKAALLNQKIVAGLGNVLGDEICFETHLHPEVRLEDLDRSKLGEISRETKNVLEVAIAYAVDGDPMPDDYLFGHRGRDDNCPRCGTSIERVKVNQRSSYFCPRCQGEGP